MEPYNNIIVFLGPSLPREEAKKILPDACYLPPIRCGDIFRAMRLQPKTIAIIDGVFENTAAVWHKEILCAIEKGINVFGASSMGALRAAELADLGMVGIGEIFSKFYADTYTDDDEVAVLHSTSDDYSSVNEPMVNIRATLNKATQNEIIDTITAQIIADSAKQRFYPERNFAKACEDALKNGANAGQIAQFTEWLQAGYVDQKRLDAIALLEYIQAEKETIAPELKTEKQKTNCSIFCRTLRKEVMCRPFTTHQDWLPITEKVAMAARFLDKDYKLVRDLAHTLAVLDALANKEKERNTTTQIISLLPSDINHEAWPQNNDCAIEEKNAFIKRISRIQQYVNSFLDGNDALIACYLLNGLRTVGDYRLYKDDRELYKNQYPIRMQTLNLLAHLYAALDVRAQTLNIEPTAASLQAEADNFRRKHLLLTTTATTEWFAENELELADFQELITALAKIEFITKRNNLDIFELSKFNTETWWLLDAMRITGLYEAAKPILTDIDYKTKVINNFKQNAPEDLEQHAFSLDFIHGEQDLQNHL